MNFITAFRKGQEGRNFGLDTGLSKVNLFLGGIQRKAVYTIAGAPKSGKTAFVDNLFLIYPFIDSQSEKTINRGIEVEWIYFSYEIDRIKKHFRLLPLLLQKEYGKSNYIWKGKTYDITPMLLEGKLHDEQGELITLSEELRIAINHVYEKWLIPMFGEYDDDGNRIKKGKVDFIEEKMNPTGMYHYLMSYAKKNGSFIYEPFEMEVNGKITTKQRVVGYKPNNPNKITIIITDHMRKLRKESGNTLKENIDQWLTYQIWYRNICGFTFVDIIHTNRNLADVDKLKFMKDKIYPDIDDLKDSGNLAEDSDYVITLFNPRDDKYQIRKHFDISDITIPKYKNVRSMHLVASRDTECPVHLHLDFIGHLGLFKQYE